MVGRPMPVKNILSTSGVPIPFHFLPKLINLLRNSLFLFVSIFVIFPYCDQSLHEKGGLHQIAPIVVISKRLHFTCVTVQPRSEERRVGKESRAGVGRTQWSG